MAKLTIGDKTVTIDDSFRNLSPDEQQKAVEEIASKIGVQSAAAPKSLLDEASDNLATGFTAGVDAIPFVGQRALSGLEKLKAAAQNTIYGNKGSPMFDPGYQAQSGEDVHAADQTQREEHPVADIVGSVVGPTLALAPFGATALGAKLLGLTGSLPARMGWGAASALGMTGGDALARGQSLDQAGLAALRGAGVGALLPFVGSGVSEALARITGKTVSRDVKQVAKGLEREGLDAPAAQKKLADMGPEGTIADLGPNLTRQASTIASLPGEGQAIIRDRFVTRAKGANQRIKDTLDNELGPSPIPSMEKAGIKAQQDALSPSYEQALVNAQPIDASRIAANIEATVRTKRGEPQKYLERLRPMLNAYSTDKLTVEPRVLLEVRHAIDGFMEGDLTKDTRRVLGNVRKQVDDELTTKVPFIKKIDAHYSELARQSDALDRGGQVLGTGPETVWPQDLAVEHGLASPGVQQRLSQGARASIERIVGTNSNDVQALNKLIKGEGSWNEDRLTTLFGAQKTKAIMRVLQNELQFSRTYGTVMSGPETAARLHGGQELGERNFDVPKGTTWTGLGLNAVTGGVNKVLNADREAVNARIADLLTRRGPMPRRVAEQIARAQGRRRGYVLPAVPALVDEQNPDPLNRGAGPVMITIRGGR